jgi:hypothetical protein
MATLKQRALAAKRETRAIEFKEAFDPSSRRDWCELIKDVISIANSGGGIIVFGYSNRGEVTGNNLSALKALDPAKIADQIKPYIGRDFADIEIGDPWRGGKSLVTWTIAETPVPLVFVKPGTYSVEGGKQDAAFRTGIYFRHGAKSEPGTSDDLAKFIEHRMAIARKEWFRNVRKVSAAPIGAEVIFQVPTVRHSADRRATEIRITTNPSAPAYKLVNPDVTHPYRQKELVAEVNKKLPRVNFNSFDVQSIRHTQAIDGKPEFLHKPQFGSPQYSQEFVDWIVERVQSNKGFLKRARSQYRDLLRLV